MAGLGLSQVLCPFLNVLRRDVTLLCIHSDNEELCRTLEVAYPSRVTFIGDLPALEVHSTNKLYNGAL